MAGCLKNAPYLGRHIPVPTFPLSTPTPRETAPNASVIVFTYMTHLLMHVYEVKFGGVVWVWRSSEVEGVGEIP